jgi:hypothetical protein
MSLTKQVVNWIPVSPQTGAGQRPAGQAAIRARQVAAHRAADPRVPGDPMETDGRK